MRAKKPLLIALLVLALLVVALILPAAASAEQDEVTTAWVAGACDIVNNDIAYARTGVNVRLSNGELEGCAWVNRFRSPATPPGLFVGTAFTDQENWLTFFGPLATSNFHKACRPYYHKACEPYEWPAELMTPGVAEMPLLADTYRWADIADFVVYTPNPFPDLVPLLGPTWPHRWVIINFPHPWAKDLIQIYAWGPLDPEDQESPWCWMPQMMDPVGDPAYAQGDPVPVSNGGFWMHLR